MTWRDSPPTPDQLRLVRDLQRELNDPIERIPMTGDEASRLIRQLIARRKIRQGRFSTIH